MSLKLVPIIYNRNPPFSSELSVFCLLFIKKHRDPGKEMRSDYSENEQKDKNQSERSSSSSFTVAVRGAVRPPMRLPEPPPDEALDRTTRQIGP